MTRFPICIGLLLASLWPAGCGGGKTTAPDSAAGDPEGPALGQIPKSAPRNIEPEPGGNFLVSFPLGSIVSGGVVKDGIPALTDPIFVSASSPQADYVRENDIVLGLTIGGEARAYPHNIGWWHEIVNDRIAGRSVVVSLCPLTGTGMVHDGEGDDGKRVALGVSGRLFNNNLVMYDRRDPWNQETFYPQMLGRGVSGPRAGSDLELLPVVETTWRFWKQMHPDTRVISKTTGHSRSYVSYPYGNYRDPSTPPTFQTTPSPAANTAYDLYGPKEMVLGVRFGEIAMAYPFASMDANAVINDVVASNPIVVVFYEEERLALAFDRTVDGEVLTFEKVAATGSVFPFAMQDAETGSQWNLMGESLSGSMAGKRLRQIPAHNAFWFAWVTFWQNTGVF